MQLCFILFPFNDQILSTVKKKKSMEERRNFGVKYVVLSWFFFNINVCEQSSSDSSEI